MANRPVVTHLAPNRAERRAEAKKNRWRDPKTGKLVTPQSMNLVYRKDLHAPLAEET